MEINAKTILERRHSEVFSTGRGSDYIYQAGSIGQHIVVITTLLAGLGYGTGSAATSASQAEKSFSTFRFGFFVVTAAFWHLLSLEMIWRVAECD